MRPLAPLCNWKCHATVYRPTIPPFVTDGISTSAITYVTHLPLPLPIVNPPHMQVRKLGSLAFQGITVDSDDELASLDDDDSSSNGSFEYEFGATSGSKLVDK